jgi:hypothetical protein
MLLRKAGLLRNRWRKSLRKKRRSRNFLPDLILIEQSK